jgi:hypothetical protein
MLSAARLKDCLRDVLEGGWAIVVSLRAGRQRDDRSENESIHGAQHTPALRELRNTRGDLFAID